MLRDPDVSATHIAFRYADDLWLVPRNGGTATPLANPTGIEWRPRFSPDGHNLAFVGNYDGDDDIYILPVAGGQPRRVTHVPFSLYFCDWTPDGGLLFSMPGSTGFRNRHELFTVPAEGGLPARLPVPSGAVGTISPDGRWIAYGSSLPAYYRTWKRYLGGTADEIWLLNFEDHTWLEITDWEGADTDPMWHGQTVYYLSDAGPAHRRNIWVYDLATETRRQLTHFTDFDIKQVSIGPGSEGGGEIVFTLGADLVLFDLETQATRTVPVHIPGARSRLRPQLVDVSDAVGEFSPSPSGQRVAVEARGDIWTLPAKHGTPRNLTRSNGVAERSPAWSPDGRWIAFFSDRSGEYELYLIASDGSGEQRQLTHGSRTFYTRPVWSPDAAHIAYVEKTGDLWLHTLDGGTRRRIATDPWARSPNTLVWSPDSRWIAFDRATEAGQDVGSIWLYDVERGQSTKVTGDLYSDYQPTFDREGEYLFFISNRSLEPSFSDLEFAYIHENAGVLVAAPLRRDVELPYRARSDEEEPEKEGEEDEAEIKDENGDGPEPIPIDLDGFEERAFQVPVTPGSFARLAVTESGELVYLRRSGRGHTEGTALQLFDLADEEKEEKTVTTGVRAFALTADGKKVVVRPKNGNGLAFHDLEPDAEAKKVITDGMYVTIDPHQEWRQIFTDAWRLFRDFFYDPDMHRVDWQAVREHYAQLLDDCASRADLSYVISEMIAELSVGHARLGRGAPEEDEPEVAVGTLGVDWELDRGAYRIVTIYQGPPWDLDARNPLREPGVDVNEGEYLLAVNGIPVDTTKDPWAAFVGLADREVTLTIGTGPTADDDKRQVVVKAGTASSEQNLRRRDWLERTWRHVDERTGGRVGYVYIPNYMAAGLNMLVRQYFPQRHKEALIIDQRWNGGGWTPHRFIEILNRPLSMVRARRDGKDQPVPGSSHFGPKCLLMNKFSGSSGDMFPWMFRQAGLGKLIGTRTWGGVVGLSGTAVGMPRLIDGQHISIPNNGTYGPDGRWIIEGWGVDPDIEVKDDPSKMPNGEDLQLEAAIELMLEVIESEPYTAPRRPPGPDRSGMGVPMDER